MKKILGIILALALMMSMGLGATALAEGGGDIRGYFASSPETIDPTMNSSMDGATYIVHLFQGLFHYKWDATGVELGDAASYVVSEDALTWTFTLRDDIKWSDGVDVTAFDYEYAWKRLCDPAVAAPYAEDLGQFILNGLAALDGEVGIDEVGVKALDEKTLEVKLEGPCPFFDEVAAFPVLYPVRQDIIEANGEGWWTNPETYITNGPFKMKSFSLDEDLVIVPNESYYDAAKVVPDSITFRFLANENVALAALRANEIDIANNAPPEEVPALLAEGLLDVRDQLGTYYLSFNVQVAPYDNPLVRKALTLAIDRKYIAEVIMENTRVPATGMVGGGFGDAEPGSDFRAVGGEFISLDYEANCILAQEALAEAGYPGGDGFPTVEYMYNTSAGHQAIGEVIAKSWEDVLGIKVNLVNQEWNSFLDTRRKGNYEVARNGWVSDWNDPSSMLTIFISGGGNNDGFYNNPDFDAYMAASLATNDRAARMEAMHNAEKVLMDDWGCAPVLFYKNSFMVTPNLHNWYYLSTGYTLLHMASID